MVAQEVHMALTLTRHDPAGFLGAAGGFLARREAEENLLLGLAHQLAAHPRSPAESAPYLATVVESDGRVVMAALRTPPRFLVLSRSEHKGAAALMLADVLSRYPDLPGVLGPVPLAAAFAAEWAAATDSHAERTLVERIYALQKVIAPAPPSGSMRRAEARDRDLLERWLIRFFEETGANGNVAARDAARGTIRDRLDTADAGLYFWDDPDPVALAGFSGPTPAGVRIGPVYTPLDRRRRGYAAALVAALSQTLLDRGRTHCFLFADVANPTSNGVYQRIGYRPVADVEEYRFTRG
jgi:predicted GNAT family acetyltransferase